MSTLGPQFKTAVVTLVQMLTDRGENISGLSGLGPSDLDKLSSSSTIVTLDTGARTIVFFLKKLKTSDVVKSAAEVPDSRKLNAIIVTADYITSVHVKSIHSNYSNTVELMALPTLYMNVSRHRLVPKHELVDPNEVKVLQNKLQLGSTNQLPAISSSDPMAKYIGARIGDVVRITRMSPTTGTQIAFRVCRR